MKKFVCGLLGFNESKRSVNKREQYMKNRDEGIPYNVIGNGIMVADAEDVRKHANLQAMPVSKSSSTQWTKHQFDNCNEYFNKQQTQFANQHTIDILRETIKLCEDYSNDRYNLYKGRSPYKGNEEGRADNYVEGQSAGAECCIGILEEMLENLTKGEK